MQIQAVTTTGTYCRTDCRARLQAMPGTSPWSAGLIAARQLDHADAFPASDLGLRPAAAVALGREHCISAKELEHLSQAWRPRRTTAAAYLWMCASARTEVARSKRS